MSARRFRVAARAVRAGARALGVISVSLSLTAPALARQIRQPSWNFAPAMPAACLSHGDGAGIACTRAAIRALDAARARLGEPPYRLPGDFLALSPARQLFVLADLDRVLYGLAPVPG